MKYAIRNGCAHHAREPKTGTPGFLLHSRWPGLSPRHFAISRLSEFDQRKADAALQSKPNVRPKWRTRAVGKDIGDRADLAFRAV